MDTTRMFIEFLQSCITPVAVISGVGLLLLSITNRMARTVDRIRLLVRELDEVGVIRREKKENEIKILYRRSRYLRNSIGAIVVSVICTSLIIPVLFFMNLFRLDLRIIGYLLFFLVILSILVSLLYFFRDVVLSLRAVKLEAREYLP